MKIREKKEREKRIQISGPWFSVLVSPSQLSRNFAHP
jgi:hypothetical protein